jgi:hypothetical protein
LAHFLSEADSAALLVRTEKKSKAVSTSKDHTGEPDLGNDSSLVHSLDEVKREAIVEAIRPVIHFDDDHSYMSLNPQRDIQGSWTVEFWLKREEPPVPFTESVQPSPQREAPITEAFSAAFPRTEKRPQRSLLGARSGEFGGFEVRDFATGIPDKTQSTRSKLSQILGTDFAGLDRGGKDRSVWGWGSDEAMSAAEAGMNEALERFDDLREGRGGRSNWTLVPPASSLSDSLARLHDEEEDDDLTGIDMDLGAPLLQSNLLSQEQPNLSPSSPSSFIAAPNLNPNPNANSSSFMAACLIAQEMQNQRPSNPSTRNPPNLDSTVDPTVENDSKERENTAVSLTSLSREEEIRKVLQREREKEKEERKDEKKREKKEKEEREREEKKEENIPLDIKEKEKVLQPIYLLSSSGGYVKLQMGGRVFSQDQLKDPLQESDPVTSQAYCISVGQRGATEKSFDFVVPAGVWIHLAISCSVGVSSSGSSSVVSLYVNGKLKDSHNMRFNLPIATIGSNRRGQSYFGLLGEMRVWSTARSSVEIKRDLRTDVSG